MSSTIMSVSASSALKSWFLPLAVFVLVVLHGVGIWGLLFSGQTEQFQKLTPFNLLVSNVLLFAFHRDWRPAFVIFLMISLLVGFFSEVAGIHTGLIFGDYTYGESLGTKVMDVPLLIGLNWLMLVYTTGVLFSISGIPVVLRILGSALLMVAIDFLIEPVAIAYDFWSWQSEKIPMANYIGWFVIACVLQVFFQLLPFRKNNALAPWLLLIQVVFFLTLNMALRA